MVTALNVANNILQRAFADDINVTPMKLQKLIYCIYKEYLKKTGYSLFEEDFEAWKYGPVIPSVYQMFKDRGSNRINNYADANKGIYKAVNENNKAPFKQIVDKIWSIYKDYNGIVISSFTYGKNTAWRNAVKERRNQLLVSDIKSEEDYVGKRSFDYHCRCR